MPQPTSPQLAAASSSSPADSTTAAATRPAASAPPAHPFTAPIAVHRLLPGNNLLPPEHYHLSLLSDIYLLPCSRSPCPHQPKSWHALRSLKRIRLELTRLPDPSSVSDLDAAVSSYTHPSVGRGFALRVTGTTRANRTTKRREDDTRILVTPSEDERDAWLSALRLLLVPAPMMLDEVKAAFDGTSGAGSGIAEDARRALNRAAEAVGASAAEAVGGGFDDAAAFSRTAFGLAGAGTGMGFITTCLQGLHDVVSPDGVDAVTRAFGGVALVGPLFVVAGLVVKGASMMAEAEAQIPSLIGMRQKVEFIATILFIIAHDILHTRSRGEIFQRSHFTEDVFGAVVTCAGIFADVERHILHKRVWRAWNAEQVEQFGGRIAELKVLLKFSRHAQFAASLESLYRGLESEVAGMRDQFSSMNVGDVFQPVWYNVPEVPENVVVTGLPQLERLLEILRSGGGIPAIAGQDGGQLATAAGCGLSARSLCVQGWGGVGKTTACIIAARDEKVQLAFPAGGLFLNLGQHVTDKDVAGQLRDYAFVTGGKEVASAIEKVEEGRMQVSRVVGLVTEWMKGRGALFVVDNVFDRAQGVPWVVELLKLVEYSGSAFLFSTRHANLAKITPPERRFVFQRVQDPAVARDIFYAHAGLRLSEPAVDEKRRLTVEFILGTCDGWHLALKVAGKGAKILGYDWQKLKDAIDDALLLEFDDGVEGSVGVGIVLSANLQLLSGLPRSRFLLLGAPSLSSENSIFFENAYRRLVVLANEKTVPLSLLAPVFGVPEPEAEALATLFHDAGLATFELRESDKPDGGASGGSSGRILSLHDLQLQFVSSLCKPLGVDSVAAQHWQFLNKYCLLYGDDNSRVASFDWWRLFEDGASTSHIYMRSNLFVHLNAASAHCPEDVLATEFFLLSSFSWLLGCWCAGGRRAAVADCNIVLSTTNASNLSGDQRQTIVSLKRTLLLVEDSVTVESSGALASALVQQAGCLYESEGGGVFPVRAFAKAILKSASADVREGFFLPLSGCVRDSDGWRDARVLEKAQVGEGGPVVCVAPLGDGCHAVSAGEDGYLRVLEGAELGVVLKWEGHGGKVIRCFAIQRNSSCSFSIFSGGGDELVRAWEVSVDEAHFPTFVEEGVVGYCGSTVCCITVSEDRRVVAAGCVDGKVRIWKKRDDATSFAFDLVKTFCCGATNEAKLAMSGCGGIVVAGTGSGGPTAERQSLRFWKNGYGEGEVSVAMANATERAEEEWGWIVSIVLNESDSSAIVFFGYPEGYEVWDLGSKSRRGARNSIGGNGRVRSVSLLGKENGPHGRETSVPTRCLVVWGSNPCLIIEYGLLTGDSLSLSELARYEMDLGAYSVCYASFGGKKRAIAGCDDGMIFLLDLEVSERQESSCSVRREPVGEQFKDGACQAGGDSGDVALEAGTAVAVLPKCGRVLVGHEDGAISVWCGKSGKFVRRCGNEICNDRVYSLDVSKSENAVVSAHGSGSVIVWQAQSTGDDWQAQLALRGSDRQILSVDFSHEGRRIVAVDTAGKVRMWDANIGSREKNRDPLALVSTHFRPVWVYRSAVSRNGNYFVFSANGKSTAGSELPFVDVLICIDLGNATILSEEFAVDGAGSAADVFERFERDGLGTGGGGWIGESFSLWRKVLLVDGKENILIVEHNARRRLQGYIRAGDGSKLGCSQLLFDCPVGSFAAEWMPQDDDGCRRVLIACGIWEKARPAILHYILPTSQ